MEELLARLGGWKKECKKNPDPPVQMELTKISIFQPKETTWKPEWECKYQRFNAGDKMGQNFSGNIRIFDGSYEQTLSDIELQYAPLMVTYRNAGNIHLGGYYYSVKYKFIVIDKWMGPLPFGSDSVLAEPVFMNPHLKLCFKIVLRAPTMKECADARKEIEELRTYLRNTLEQLRLCQQSKAPSKDINKPFTGPPSTAALVEE